MSRTKDQLETIVRQNREIWNETSRHAEKFGKVPPAISIKQIPVLAYSLNSDRVIKVFNDNLLEVAEIASIKGLNPLVINTGSDNDPMKVLHDGAIGTEWDLFRRSDLHLSLKDNDCYPLRNGAILYAPEVHVFRTNKYKLRKPFKISVLTIPPIRRPGLISSRVGDGIRDEYRDTGDANKMQKCIESIFQVALLKGHRCVVIDDFGCQRNCENPIDTVIDMFNETIRQYPVKYVFFAVSEPQIEAMNADNKKRNLVYRNYVKFDRGINR
jgi:hypothetical protein